MDKQRSRSAKEIVLIFDGECGFCTTCVRVISKLLPWMPNTGPFQTADLPRLDLTSLEAAQKVWLVERDSKLTSGKIKKFGGHKAVAQLLKRQPAIGWRFLGFLLTTFPFSLFAEASYWLVARYRYRLPGGTPACEIGARK